MRDLAPDAWFVCWAKTGRDPLDRSSVTEWLPLHQHLADTAGVAGRLVDEWVSPQVVRRIAGDLGGTADDVRTVATWLAAVHDVGKISPAFVVQAGELADAMRRHGLDVKPGVRLDPDRRFARHEVVGQRSVHCWLADVQGFDFDVTAAQFACVVGGHHGEPPPSSILALVDSRTDLSGDGAWERARHDALAWATDLVGGPDTLGRYAGAQLSRPSQALLSGIVIMADWIASNAEWFRLDPLHTAHEPPRRPDAARTAARLDEGWAALDLPHRFTPSPVTDARAAFVGRFGREPRPVQVAAVEAAMSQPEPGLVIVEAPMGEGKTEAALLAAEALAARSGADGCFVALPTRATTDAMFGRVRDWMRAVPGLALDTSIVLAHGTASLNDEYRGLLRHDRGQVRGVAEDGGADDVGVAHPWLHGRKRGPLAQFVVGTIDQVLFAGLRSRHLVLRHLGLAGKVVVVDEVHSYDVFMSRYLDTVLHWLGAYGTPVVLLSATLPAARRAELMRAYGSGRGTAPATPPDDPGYPVVLASGLPPRSVSASGPPRPVAIERRPDDLDDLVTLLREALGDGGCAVVVRNTVTRVQATADRLVAEFGEDEVTMTHSRFLACDRARLDADLLARFGPAGERPRRHVVVASQVVEQSLDVDFDLLVSDLAPVDLVLQRMGRLHRHVRTRPRGAARPRCVLVGVEDWSTDPLRAVQGSRAVYGEHTLLRAAALLADRDTVTLPGDIPTLVQAGYGSSTLGPATWQEAMTKARAVAERRAAGRRAEAGKFVIAEAGPATASLDAWVRGGVGDVDDDPRRSGQVRDGDESFEVLVVQRDRDGGLRTPSWVPGGGVQVPLDTAVEWPTARTIAACALRLPASLCRMDAVGDGVLRALERNHFTSFEQHPLLKGQLVLVLDEERAAVVQAGAAHFRLSYDPRRGLSYGLP